MKDYLYAVIVIALIFICTTIGALFVFFFKNKTISPRLNKIFIGFAAGVMLCASFTSLIVPALNSEVTYMLMKIKMKVYQVGGSLKQAKCF